MSEPQRKHETSTFNDFMKLPNEIQAEVLKFCDFQTKINLSETCKHLNELLFSSSKLSRCIRLKICCFHSEDDRLEEFCGKLNENLAIIKRNRRKYTKLWLFNADNGLASKSQNNLLRTLKTVGKNVKELHILCGTFDVNTFAGLLSNFRKLEKITLQNVNSFDACSTKPNANRKWLQSLNELTFNRSSFELLKAFNDLKRLDKLCLLICREDISKGIDKVEEFLLQLKQLKELKIHKNFDGHFILNGHIQNIIILNRFRIFS
jgi:F-box domain